MQRQSCSLLRQVVIRWLAMIVCVVLLGGSFYERAAAREVPAGGLGVKSLAQALLQAQRGDTIVVDNGVYVLHIELTPGVTLIAKNRFGAILDGGGRGVVVVLGSDNLVAGFEIRNGTIGLYSNGASNTIRSCRIVCNWQTGIVAVRTLPRIQDNLIVFNRASGIQCWDVQALDSAAILNNTIAFNRAHGVSLGGRCRLLLQNNIIAFNGRLGLKVAAQAKQISAVSNNFYCNRAQSGGALKGNYSFDPSFMAPRIRYDFSSSSKASRITVGSDKRDLGAQFR